MADLRAYRILSRMADGEPLAGAEADAVAADLRELAGAPTDLRLALLPHLPAALEHADAKVRAAAVAVHAGFDGWSTRRRIVRCLDDDAASVRTEAIRWVAARDTAAMWSHALFHRRVDVRTCACDQFLYGDDPGRCERVRGRGIGGACGWMAGALMGVDEVRPAVIAALSTEQPNVRIAVDVIFDANRRGWIDDAAATRLIEAGAGPDNDARLRLSARSDGVLLDWFFDRTWRRSGEKARVDATGYWDRWLADIGSPPPRGVWMIRDMTGGLIRAADRLGGWDDDAARLLVLSRCNRLTAIRRRVFGVADNQPSPEFDRALRSLRRFGVRVKPLSRRCLRRYLRSRWIRGGDGGLRLDVIASLLHTRRRDGFAALQAAVEMSDLRSAVNRDPAGAAVMFGYGGTSESRKRLFDEVFPTSARSDAATAVLMMTMPADTLSDLGKVSSASAVAICRAIHQSLIDQDGLKLSSRKVAAIASIIEPSLWATPKGSGRYSAKRSGDLKPGKTFAELIRGWLGGRWASGSMVTRFTVGVDLVERAAKRLGAEGFADWVIGWSTGTLRRFLSVFGSFARLSYAVECVLAERLDGHDDPEVAAWAEARRLRPAAQGPSSKAKPIVDEGSRSSSGSAKGNPQTVDAATAVVLSSGVATKIESAIRSGDVAERVGVTAAIATRPAGESKPPTRPLAAAALASSDCVVDVAATLSRLNGVKSSSGSEWLSEPLGWLTDAFGVGGLPSLAGLLMARWEAAAFRFAKRCLRSPKDLRRWWTDAVEAAEIDPALADEMAAGLTRVVRLHLARQPAAAATWFDDDSIGVVTESLSSPLGHHAAKMLEGIHKSGLAAASMEHASDGAADLLGSLDEASRLRLVAWLGRSAMSVGAGSNLRRRPVGAAAANRNILSTIASSEDVDWLSSRLRDDDPKLVTTATLRLLDLDAGHWRLLADALESSAGVPTASPASSASPASPASPASLVALAESIALWPRRAARRAASLAAKDCFDPPVRFAIAVAAATISAKSLHGKLADAIVRSLNQPCDEDFVRTADAKAIIATFGGEPLDRIIAQTIATPHPAWVRRGVTYAVSHIADPDTKADAVSKWCDVLVRFLDSGIDRDPALRLTAAATLFRKGRMEGWPIVLGRFATMKPSEDTGEFADLMGELWVPKDVRIDAATAMLAAGRTVVDEHRIASEVWDDASADPDDVAVGKLLMREAESDDLRFQAARRISADLRRRSLRRIADVFARGIRVGRELTGRLFQIEMIGGEKLGYTVTTQSRVFVNPVAMLSGVPHGEDIVSGLIVHEIGHHMYHAGETADAIWRRADREGMGSLLNLVADEHLERNLRAIDDRYGNWLKRLGAYAFNRDGVDRDAAELIGRLGGDTMAVWAAAPPGVARDRSDVHVRGGSVLRELERRGDSFARFFRALRLGLGDRHGDPRVAEALGLFDRRFRHLDMTGLYAVCERLRTIFGASCLSPPVTFDALCSGTAGELAAASGGLSDGDVRREVVRITSPPGTRRTTGKSGDGSLAINVSRELNVRPITQIVPVAYDPAGHAVLASSVATAARQVRRYLHDLGIVPIRVRRRLRGKSVDRAGLRAMVIRGEPRVLIARQSARRNDVFVSVVIDCSGSMAVGDSMDKARRFASVIAAAAGPIDGIDVRLFGFTDNVIYDAGDERRPAVSSLEPGGGNNDAAALLHAASAAIASRRSAKVVVMISDGLPTECSVEALRATVRRLSRRPDLSLAQVAVRPLEEKCFDHYVELTDDSIARSVRRFGALVAGLIRQTL